MFPTDSMILGYLFRYPLRVNEPFDAVAAEADHRQLLGDLAGTT
ncbi:MAG TPA: hypothetical protein VIK18_25310 [Pirellulales bacterium]